MNFSNFINEIRFQELPTYHFNSNKRSLWAFVSYRGATFFLKVMLKLDDTLYGQVIETNTAIKSGANIDTIPTELLKLATFINAYEILISYLGDSAKTETEHMRVLSSNCPGLTPIFTVSNIDETGNISDMTRSKTVCEQMIDLCIPRTSSSSAGGGGASGGGASGGGTDPNAFLKTLLTNGSIVPIIYVTEVFGEMIDSPTNYVEPMLQLLFELYNCTNGGLLTDPNSQQFLIKKGQRGDQFEGDSYIPDELRLCDIDELIYPKDVTKAINISQLLQLYKKYVLKIKKVDDDGNIGFIKPGVNDEVEAACYNSYIYGWLVKAIFKNEQRDREREQREREQRERARLEGKTKRKLGDVDKSIQPMEKKPDQKPLHCCRLGSYCPFGNYCPFNGGKSRRNKSRRNKSRRNKSRRNTKF
jgi:hypothetical protein